MLTLTAAGRRRIISFLQPRLWYPLSSKAVKLPSNPFEIDLSSLQTPLLTTEKLTLSDAKCASALQQIDAENDIRLLHNEMSELFGQQVTQYEGDNSSSIAEEAMTVLEKTSLMQECGMELYKEDGANVGEAIGIVQSKHTSIRALETVRADAKLKKFNERERTGKDNLSGTSTLDVLLLQGSCSFVCGVWTGGDVGRKELGQRIQALADDLKVVVKGYNYDSEKMILEKILDAREDQVIVLCWNISLSKSPFIVHALELIQSNVIIVSPSNVEHGPLPTNVVGVLSGFRDQSLSLALNAAVNLCGPNANKD